MPKSSLRSGSQLGDVDNWDARTVDHIDTDAEGHDTWIVKRTYRLHGDQRSLLLP